MNRTFCGHSQGQTAEMMTRYHEHESHSEPADVDFCVGGCLSLYARDEVVNCVGQNLLQNPSTFSLRNKDTFLFTYRIGN